MRRVLMLLVALSLFATGCGTATRTTPAAPVGPGESPKTSTAKDGGTEKPAADAAPDFTVETFTGDRFSLGEQKGTPVVLNFWESW